MKSNHTKWLLALAMLLVAALAVSQTVVKAGHAGGDFPFGGHMFNFFADYLDLTDAQQAQAKEIMAKDQPAMQPYMDQLKQGHDQLWQLVESGNFDEAKVRALASQNSQALTELLVQQTRMHTELYQLLTPEQKTKMGKFMSRHEQRFMDHMEHPPSPQ